MDDSLFVLFLSDPGPIIVYACQALTDWLTNLLKIEWIDQNVQAIQTTQTMQTMQNMQKMQIMPNLQTKPINPNLPNKTGKNVIYQQDPWS